MDIHGGNMGNGMKQGSQLWHSWHFELDNSLFYALYDVWERKSLNSAGDAAPVGDGPGLSL